ncbi:zinc-dependent alcohol dehydrogenase family protein [Alkalicoccobacillus murimartini]|nr:zinc-dependent alcohol dehydrogenase family protein [Alkalicoccobacillus murimartini]
MCEQFGEPKKVLTIRDQEQLVLEEHQLRVKMIYAPINPSDLIPIRGSYAQRISLPYIPGYEGVGKVVDVGCGVSETWIGKRVLPLRGEGTWQEYVTSPAEWAVEVPETMSDFIAAQAYINPLTAWIIATETLDLQPGETIAVNAANSVLGRLLIQLSQHLRFNVIAIVRRTTQVDELQQLGAYQVLLKDIDSVDAAIDMAGGSSGTELACCVKSGGTCLSVGLLSGKPMDVASVLARKHINLKMFHLRHWNAKTTTEQWHKAFLMIKKLLEQDIIQIKSPCAIYSYQDWKEAVVEAENRQGKVFLSF